MPRRLVLASASRGRLGMLRAAGVNVHVEVSGVPEGDVGATDPSGMVLELARRKASTVAGRLADAGDTVVLGCDSMLNFGGHALGKPATPAEAARRWREYRGRRGELLTGHWLIDVGTGRQAGDVASATVRFGHPTDGEIDAYVASGEPLQVAGGFTIDGRGAWFVEGIDGSPSTVIGLSLPLLRRLLAELGTELLDLWE